MTKTRSEDLDWNQLGFKYHDLPYRWVDEFKNGKAVFNPRFYHYF